MKIYTALLLVFVAFATTACAPSHPLIGRWVGTVNGQKAVLTFTATASDAQSGQFTVREGGRLGSVCDYTITSSTIITARNCRPLPGYFLLDYRGPCNYQIIGNNVLKFFNYYYTRQ